MRATTADHDADDCAVRRGSGLDESERYSVAIKVIP